MLRGRLHERFNQMKPRGERSLRVQLSDNSKRFDVRRIGSLASGADRSDCRSKIDWRTSNSVHCSRDAFESTTSECPAWHFGTYVEFTECQMGMITTNVNI